MLWCTHQVTSSCSSYSGLSEGCPILTNGLCWWLAYRKRNINNNNNNYYYNYYYGVLFLGLQVNLFCTNRTIGMTSFSISTDCTGTNGPLELMNHILLCILDMSVSLNAGSWLKEPATWSIESPTFPENRGR